MQLTRDPAPSAIGENVWRRCAWLGATFLVAFLLSRAWMFLPQVPRFQGIGHDAAWFWDLQAQVERGPDAPATDYQRARLLARSNSDMVVTRGVAELSRATGWDRWRLNQVLTTAIFLLAVGLTFLLSAELLGSSAWAMPLTVLLTQSRAFAWLDYQVFAPKMLGFALFPWLLLLLVRYARGSAAGHRPVLGLLLFMGLLYGPTAIYLLPVVMPILAWIVWRSTAVQGRWRILFEITIVGVISLALIRAVSGGMAAAHPPSHAIAEYFYSNHHLGRSLGPYWRGFLDLAILALLAGALLLALRRRGVESITAQVLLAGGGGCLFLGLAVHALAAHVDIIRMLWLWRISYYAHLPLMLFVVIVGALAVRQQADHLLRRCGIALIAGCAVSVLVIGSGEEHAWRSLAKTVRAALSGTIDDAYSARVAPLVDFARRTPASSVFLLPSPSLQTIELGHLFEAESGRSAALSISEKYLMIIEMPITTRYHAELLALDAAYRAKGQERLALLRQVAARAGATHIIAPVGEHGETPLWADAQWMVFAARVPGNQDGRRTSN